MARMTDRELDRAAHAAAALELAEFTERRRASEAGGGYVSPVPDWLHDAVDNALPEHLGYGRVESLLLQRGPVTTGGYRFARPTDDTAAYAGADRVYHGLSKLLPRLLRARFRRLLSEVDRGAT